jgi:hypothetical protein
MKLAQPVGGESSRQSWRVVLGIVLNSVRTRTSFGNNKFGKNFTPIRVIIFALPLCFHLRTRLRGLCHRAGLYLLKCTSHARCRR